MEDRLTRSERANHTNKKEEKSPNRSNRSKADKSTKMFGIVFFINYLWLKPKNMWQSGSNIYIGKVKTTESG